jgi:aldehyde dehydrogenase (NAD+)
MTQAIFIDNTFMAGEGERMVVRNPANEKVVAEFAGASTAQVEAAILSARRAFDDGRWGGLPAAERAAALRRYSAALTRRLAAAVDLVVTETGCPRHSPIMFIQVAAPLKQVNEIVDLFLSLPQIEDNPLPLRERVNYAGQMLQSVRRYTPIGVVAAIAAYNFPYYTALWKVIPALIAGNTVVLRPSPLTPLSVMIFAEAAVEAGLPPGVLNVVVEGGLEGARLLTTHAGVDMVAFTGSSSVGKQVMIQAAETMKRLQLELGGKSAQIFLPDALDRAPAAAAAVCTSHAGQACVMGTRIFVPEERKAATLAAMAQVFSALRVGDSESRDTQVGPVISAAQRERCERYTALAVAAGARVVSGGKRPVHMEHGYYFEPTLLDVPDNDNPAARDEIFGPVVTVIGYRDLDHAVAMANDSRFGLSGYVHSADKAAAIGIATRLKTGAVNVNTGMLSTYVSGGGQRESGVGRERGIEGLRLYQQLSCINIGG